jgi:Domain of unknown function (DUF4954)
MPAYWFLYNMYALARNSWKYVDRDKRTDKTQTIEYDFLAPDSINEIITALGLIEKFTAQAYVKQYENNKTYAADELQLIGKKLLEIRNNIINDLEILAENFEHSDRKVRLIKVLQAYHLYKEIISYYAVIQVVENISINKYKTFAELQTSIPAKLIVSEWVNAGGQLIQKTALQKFIQQIHTGKIKNWEAVHQFYIKQGENYLSDKLHHALAAFKEVHGIQLKKIDKSIFKNLLMQSITTKEWMTKAIYDSRAKDYTNPFRKMVYDSNEEMNAVIGSLQKNSFIKQEIERLAIYKKTVNELIKKMKL